MSSTGQLLWKYDYDAFGNEKEIAGQDQNLDLNPFRYCGEYFDKETGSVYLRARYYSPRLGRFGSEDPARSGLNWYVYCGGNPLAFVDPLGLDAILINKNVDNFAGYINVEHMGAFFQDKNKDWYFLFYGDKVVYEKVDSGIFDNLDSVNEYLYSHGLYAKEDRPYLASTYVKGDFTVPHEEAQKLQSKYADAKSIYDATEKVGDKEYFNADYNGVLNNCGQVTMRLFYQGTLPNGTKVGDYVKLRGHGNSVLPNENMWNMQSIFYNNATNRTGFEVAMQAQRNKYEGKNVFAQLWYSNLRNNINTIG